MKDLLNRKDIVGMGDNVYLIQAPDQARFPFCNSFLLTGKETVLIDAGIGGQKIQALDKIKRIDILIISHSHPDHLLAWHYLEDRYLLIPKETPENVKDLMLLGKRFTPTSEGAIQWADMVGKGLGIRPLREPDGRFGPADRLELGGAQLEAIHAPGHIDDHYCFYDHKSGSLLTTDIDFTSFGPWYGNPESDIERFEESIKKVMGFPYRSVCSSHKPVIEGDATQQFQAYLDAFDRQRQAIFSLCDPPRTLEQIVAASPLYRNRSSDKTIQLSFEETMILKNLELLIRDGRVITSGGKYKKI
jgi:glyoxylase-like metal-dependent hydrolase (beta-lactamase superfamily II)